MKALVLVLVVSALAQQAPLLEPVRLTTSHYYETDPAWCPVLEEVDGVRAARLAFARYDGRDQEIWSVLVGRDETGALTIIGEEKRLTSGGGEKGHPSWSFDGTKLYYEELEPGGDWVVRELSLVEPAAEPRTVASGREPSAGPGGKLAFVRGGAVFAVDSVSTTPRVLGLGSRCSSPSWTPDGRRVFFACGLFIAFAYDQTGAGGTNYYLAPPVWPDSWNGHPAISPAAPLLAFLSTRDRAYGIWVARLDRPPSEARLLYGDACRKRGLSFSPDPDVPLLAFASDRAGGWDIWVVEVSGDLFPAEEEAPGE